MKNFATNQNQQPLMSSQDHKADVHKGLNRRNWLRNAVMAVTGAFALFLSGCTKEQWDDVKEQIPGGGLGSAPGPWYYLKVNYRTEKGGRAVGYLAPTGTNWTTPSYTSMRILGGTSYATKFRLSPADEGDGWQYLQADDHNWLGLGYDGWFYRYPDKSNAWKIVGGKLYSNYERWHGYPAGAQWRGKPNVFVLPAYYVGVDLGDDYVLTGCELVPAE